MSTSSIQLLLADDDRDDCFLFKEALEELSLSAGLTVVNDGEELMKMLVQTKELPSVLFLDLNMPRKNGFECLEEIRKNKKFSQLPVIIISTSFDEEIADKLYKDGAQHYICKPNEFDKLKKVIHKALFNIVPHELLPTSPGNFVLHS